MSSLGFCSPSRFVDYFFAISIATPTSTRPGASQFNVSTDTVEPAEVENWRLIHYYSYPTIDVKDDSLRNISPFCFPSYARSLCDLPEPSYHDFVLTDEFGKKRYACCLRTRSIVLMSPSPRAATDPDSADLIHAYCFVSGYPWLDAMRAVLTEFYLGRNANISLENFVCRVLNEIVVPSSLSSACSTMLVLPRLNSSYCLRAPISCHDFPLLDFSPSLVFRSLSVSHVVDVFGLLLLEKSILLCSTSLTKLTRCAEALLAILYPLQWDMVYVPIVPEILKDLAQAPTPFLMGGEKYWVKQLAFGVDRTDQAMMSSMVDYMLVQDQEEADHAGIFVKVDLDFDELDSAVPELRESARNLPKRSELITRLQRLLKPEMTNLDVGYAELSMVEDFQQIDMESTRRDRGILSTFLDWFLWIFRDLSKFYRSDGRFNEQAWLQSFPDHDLNFLAIFYRTSMVQNFLHIRSPDGDQYRIRDHFDRAVTSVRRNNESSRSSLDSVKDTGKPVYNTISIHIDLSQSGMTSTAVSTFRISNLLQLRESYSESKSKGDEFIFQHLKVYPENLDLLWMHAFSLEKSIVGVKTVPTQSILNCISAYRNLFEALLKSSSLSQSETSVVIATIINKVRPLYARLPKEDAEECVENLPPKMAESLRPQSSTIVHHSISNFHPDASKESLSKSSQLDVPSARTRSQSYEPSDRLILNCNPLMATHAHIAGSVSLDDEISDMELSPTLRSLVTKPLELSILLSQLLTSMFVILTDPPVESMSRSKSKNRDFRLIDEGLETSEGMSRSGAMGSMKDLRRFHPILELFQALADKTDTASDNVEQNGTLTIQDPSKLKFIKKMPTFESFKKTIVVLRHIQLEQGFLTEDDKICFWLNIRNVLLLHSLIEFGPPTSFQHRMTFFYHKPVYNIAGHLFSVNEMTYGILKAQQSLPTHLRPASAGGHTVTSPQSNPHSNLSPIHVEISTTAQPTPLFGKPTFCSHGGVDGETGSPSAKPPLLHHHDAKWSSEERDMQHFTLGRTLPRDTTFGAAKIPLRFLSTDPRYPFRVQKSSPLINFALMDGTVDGPRLVVYRPTELWTVLGREARSYLEEQILYGRRSMALQKQIGMAEIPFSLGNRRSRHVIFLPKFLLWHWKDFMGAETSQPARPEDLLPYVVYRFPDTGLTRFLLYENLVQEAKKPNSLKKIRPRVEITDEVKLRVRMERAILDRDRMEVKWLDHRWDYGIRIASQSLSEWALVEPAAR